MHLQIDRAASDWGGLTVGQTRLPLRLVVAIGGILVWLLIMLAQTGEHALTAIATNLAYLLPLVVLGTLTRTVSLRLLGTLFLIGAFLMGVMLVAGIFLAPLGDQASGLVGPLLEEALKIGPVVFLLWRWRAHRTWSIGATDVVLMAAMCGAGFGLVEDAHIRAKAGWPDQIPWLPVTEIIGGRVIPGHAIWTTIAGVGIGLGLMMWHVRPAAAGLALGGAALAAMDHVSNNIGTLEVLGTVSIVALILGVIGAVGLDLYALGRPRPSIPEFATPASGDEVARLATRWSFATGRRAVAYALWRYANASEAERDRYARAAEGAARSLVEHYFAVVRPVPAATTVPGA